MNNRITFLGVYKIQESFNNSCGVISLKLWKQFMCNFFIILNGFSLHGTLKQWAVKHYKKVTWKDTQWSRVFRRHSLEYF